MASIWQNLIEKLNSTVKLNQSSQEGIWLNIIKKGCIAHLCLNHGCPSCPQVSNKVKNIDGTFRFYPVERAIDNNESTCPANSSTWKENEIVQDVSNGKRKKKIEKEKKICEVTVVTTWSQSLWMCLKINSNNTKSYDNDTDEICGIKTKQHRPNMNIWLRGNNRNIRPAVHNKRSSIGRVISSDSSLERQQGSWIFRNAMIRPHSEMKLFHFSLFPFAFLGNTQVNCSRSL